MLFFSCHDEGATCDFRQVESWNIRVLRHSHSLHLPRTKFHKKKHLQWSKEHRYHRNLPKSDQISTCKDHVEWAAYTL